MRILVTGATGFVGRVLVRDLAQAGLHVRAATRRTDAEVGGAAETVAVGDIGPDTDWRAALAGVEAVAHLAARVHVLDEREADPATAFRHVNAEGTRRLAEAAAAAGVRRFVLVSSIKAVVDETLEGIVDDATPPRPTGAYGMSKLEAEDVLERAAAGSGMTAVTLRPPLVHGPGVGANFRRLLALCRTPLPLPFGALHNRRSLVFVDNLADAIRTALLYPGLRGGRFLVHDGPPPPMREVLATLRAAFGRSPLLVPVPPELLRLLLRPLGAATFDRLAGPLVLDDAGFRELTGWTPPFGLDDGLRVTANWFKTASLQSTIPAQMDGKDQNLRRSVTRMPPVGPS
jgi:nucleoside-diphosphate-sugar epimerase